MKKRIVLTAAGLAGALVMGGGVALATTTGPVNGGVITGCYTNAEVNGSHALVLQDSGTNCPKGTSAVSWDQTGPAGATGPAGPTGATGAQGPPGTNGTNGINGINGTSIVTSQGLPPTPCTSGDTDIDITTGDVWTCNAPNWTPTGFTIEGPQGPQGPAGTNGTAGATGPQGPAGPAGPAGVVGSLDSLNGATCDVGSPYQGTVSVSYGSAGAISITCVPTTLETLTVSIAAGDGQDAVVSSPAGIDCDPALAGSTCTMAVPLGYSVTLQAYPDVAPISGGMGPDALTGWTGAAGCLETVKPSDPTTCTVTMNAAESVSASFGGVVSILNDSGGCLALDGGVAGQGFGSSLVPGSAIAVVPYGDHVRIQATDEGSTPGTCTSVASSTAQTFSGACQLSVTDPTVTDESCEFTENVGFDADGPVYVEPAS